MMVKTDEETRIKQSQRIVVCERFINDLIGEMNSVDLVNLCLRFLNMKETEEWDFDEKMPKPKGD